LQKRLDKFDFALYNRRPAQKIIIYLLLGRRLSKKTMNIITNLVTRFWGTCKNSRWLTTSARPRRSTRKIGTDAFFSIWCNHYRPWP